MISLQQIEQSVTVAFRDVLWEPFVEAIRRYQLISPGDRIAVCISGGKDSMLMAKLMEICQREGEIPFEAVPLIMDPGYREENRCLVEENAARLGIRYTLFESDIFEIADTQERNPCFLCARMRRGALYRHAQELGCNKIALGHHFDDVIETTLMAMLWGAQLQGMPPNLESKNYPGMTLIRPMYLIHEQDILAWRDANALQFIQCACRLTEKSAAEDGTHSSKRKETKLLLQRLEEERPGTVQMFFDSLHHLHMDSMPGWRDSAGPHNYLEWYAKQSGQGEAYDRTGL